MPVPDRPLNLEHLLSLGSKTYHSDKPALAPTDMTGGVTGNTPASPGSILDPGEATRMRS